MKLNCGPEFLASGSFFTTPEKSVIIGWGERSWLPFPTASLEPHFYFPDFFLETANPWCHHTFTAEVSIDELLFAIEKLAVFLPFPSAINWISPEKVAFKAAFDELQSAFTSEILTKAVPYLFANAEATMSAPRLQRSLISLLNAAKSRPICGYGFWDGHSGLLGGTPELLFRSSSPGHRHLETVACAGTRASDLDEAAFLDDPKESHEHYLVIQGIEQSIASLGGASVVQKTDILQLAHFSHLLTPISASFDRDISFESLVSGFHPTPALGAIPQKPAGATWLRSYDQRVPRGRFGAPAGYRANDKSVCMVAIRNVQWQGAHLALGAGCGIVPASSFENEWNELQMKIASTKEILAL